MSSKYANATVNELPFDLLNSNKISSFYDYEHEDGRVL